MLALRRQCFEEKEFHQEMLHQEMLQGIWTMRKIHKSRAPSATHVSPGRRGRAFGRRGRDSDPRIAQSKPSELPSFCSVARGNECRYYGHLSAKGRAELR